MVEYYEHSNISQSQLKLLLVNPALFNTVRVPESFYEEKRHFVIGSAIDCILTTPTEFDSKYHISDIENKPTDVIKNIIHRVYQAHLENNAGSFGIPMGFNDYTATIEGACQDEEYQLRWNVQTRLNKILEYQGYWDDLIAAEGKQVLSVEEKTVIDSVVMSLTSNEITRPYIVDPTPFIGPFYKYQAPLYWSYKDVSCKCLLDLIIIDGHHKTIQPIDIKTIGDYTYNFPKSLRKRRYDIQAAFYTEALKIQYPDYKILPFKFVVESTIQPGNPLVYTCDESLLEIGKFGRKELNVVKYRLKEEILGFDQLIDLYLYHMEHGFHATKEVIESKGELLIDWEGIL